MLTVFYRVVAYGAGMFDGHRKLGNFSIQADAEKFAIGKGDWGGDATVVTVPAVCVNDKLYELVSANPVEVEKPENVQY